MLLLILHIFVAVLELLLAVYVLLSARTALANRAVAALLALFSLNGLTIARLLTTFTLGEAEPWLWLLTVTVYVISPAVYLVMMAVLRPARLRRRWLSWPFAALIALPIFSTLLDVTGLSLTLFGRPLIYQPPDPGSYSGGLAPIATFASGLLRPVFLGIQIGLPVLAMVYPVLVVALRDRRRDRSNSQLAWLLFAMNALAMIVSGGLRAVLPPAVTALAANLAFALGFTYAGLRRSDDLTSPDAPLSLRRLPQTLGNWPLFTKMVLAIVTVVLPAVLVVGLVTMSILRTNIEAQVGDNLHSLATVEARGVGNELTTQIANLRNMAQDALVITAVEGRNGTYFLRDQDSIAVEIALHEAAWPTTAGDSELMRSLLHSAAASRLKEFRAVFPAHTMLALTDQAGALVAATERPDHYDLAQSTWWPAAYGDGAGAVHIGSPQFDPQRGLFVVEIAVPIFTPGQIEASGVLFSRYSMEAISQELEQIAVGETGESELFDASGALILATEEEMAFESLASLDWDQLTSAPESWRVMPHEGSDDVVLAWALIESSNPESTVTALGWRVVVHQTTSESLAAATLAGRVALWVTLGMLGLAVGLTAVLARSLTQPLAELTQVAERIRAGDLETRIVVQTSDEIGILARTFNSMTTQLHDLITGLEGQVAERTHQLEHRAVQLQAAAEVGQAVTSILEPDPLIQQVVDLIRDRFGLYYVGLFLVDATGEWAALQAGTGEAGQAMLARGHQIKIGVGMIGWSIANAQARIALEAGEDAVRLATAELPHTRSEAALPLRSRGQVVGALTVQSDQPGAFDEATIVVLQTMADQIAVALDNARLFTASQEALKTTRRIYSELTRESWIELLRTRPGLGYRSHAHGTTHIGGTRAPETGGALQDEQAVQSDGDGGRLPLAVPIKVRGEVIGTLDTYKHSGGGEWTPEEMTFLEDVTGQLGVALESARLYSETQQRAERERLTGEITAHIRETLEVETVLKTATDEIYQALGLEKAEVLLFSQRMDEM